MSARPDWTTALIIATPLKWPQGRARRGQHLTGDYCHPLSAMNPGDALPDAIRRLRAQFNAAEIGEVELSTDCKLTLGESGYVCHVVGDTPDDPGAAAWFKIGDETFCLASDSWDTLPNNIATIAAHVDALYWQQQRGIMSIAAALRGFGAVEPDGWPRPITVGVAVAG